MEQAIEPHQLGVRKKKSTKWKERRYKNQYEIIEQVKADDTDKISKKFEIFVENAYKNLVMIG